MDKEVLEKMKETKEIWKKYVPEFLTGVGIGNLIVSHRLAMDSYKKLYSLGIYYGSDSFRYKMRRQFATNNWLKMHHIPMRRRA